MPNLNDTNLEPVSFILGGLTHGGQVHIEGTYAYLPKELAELSDDQQIDELGAVYYRPGIRRGFTPASESYLAGEYQRRIKNDMNKSDAARAASATIDGKPVLPPPTRGGAVLLPEDEGGNVRIVTGGPSGEIRTLTDDEQITLTQPGVLPGGIDPHSGEVPAGYTLQNPVTAGDIADRMGGDYDPAVDATVSEGGTAGPGIAPPETATSRDEKGNAPVHHELSVETTDQTLTPAELEKAKARREHVAAEQREAEDAQAEANLKAVAEPFDGASSATIEQTRSHLADASDDEIAAFVAWESERTDRAPRKTLLDELGA